MKEFETIKEYSNKLSSIANHIKLLEKDFLDFRSSKNFGDRVERYKTSIAFLDEQKTSLQLF